MEEQNQKINCTVESCKYNDCECNICQLEQIEVQACPECEDGRAQDESMCGSYICKCHE